MDEDEIARKLGFRIVRWLDGYQIQRLDDNGKVRSVGPAQRYAYDLWRMCVEELAPQK